MNPIPSGDDSPASIYDLCLQQAGKPYVTAKVARDSEGAFYRACIRWLNYDTMRMTLSRKRFRHWIRQRRKQK